MEAVLKLETNVTDAMGMSIDQLAQELIRLKDNGITFAEIERKTKINRSSISLLANHKRANKDVEFKIREFLNEVIDNESNDLVSTINDYKTSIELFPTSELKETLAFCEDMRKRKKMGVLIGHPGSGKTTILKEYSKRTPGAIYIEAVASMRLNDLFDIMAEACGIELGRGTIFKKRQKLINTLQGKDVMFLIDEAEYLKKWDVSKFDELRKIWDNTGTPIILCGTYELESILTRGNGKENLAQLYRRKYEIRLKGIKETEVREFLGWYNITKDAADILTAVAIDVKHGGLGNLIELLELSLEAAEGGQIDIGIVKDARNYKMLY